MTLTDKQVALLDNHLPWIMNILSIMAAIALVAMGVFTANSLKIPMDGRAVIALVSLSLIFIGTTKKMGWLSILAAYLSGIALSILPFLH